jgi:hypothetical protein
MTKAAVSLAAAVLAASILSQPGGARAQPYVYPPDPVAWMVGPGYYGFSGYPWPGPPYYWPVRWPALGCYDTVARLKGAWRRVEVCS